MIRGYVLSCTLAEPPSSSPNSLSSLIPSIEQNDAQPASPLDVAEIWKLLVAFRKFMGWQDAMLVDIEDLHAVASSHIQHLREPTSAAMSTMVTRHALPADTSALIFVAMSLGAVANADFKRGCFCFDVSIELVKQFVGQPTLHLCVAYFLQHTFALRAGTTNYAQGIVVQAIQVAHDLGLHRNLYGVQGLQIYLLIYMADQ